MENNQIINQVTLIFRETLDNDEITLKRETTATDIDDWDSLNHVQLIWAIEKHYKIKFMSSEIYNWKNIGEMIDMIAQKLQA